MPASQPASLHACLLACSYGGLRCRARNDEVFLVVAGIPTGRWRLNTRGRNITFAARSAPATAAADSTTPAALVPVPPPSPRNPCGVSAVYGDRRRHLPSSLALPLRSASLGYERRDFLPDEDAIPRQPRDFLPRIPLCARISV